MCVRCQLRVTRLRFARSPFTDWQYLQSGSCLHLDIAFGPAMSSKALGTTGIRAFLTKHLCTQRSRQVSQCFRSSQTPRRSPRGADHSARGTRSSIDPFQPGVKCQAFKVGEPVPGTTSNGRNASRSASMRSTLCLRNLGVRSIERATQHRQEGDNPDEVNSRVQPLKRLGAHAHESSDTTSLNRNTHGEVAPAHQL